ncbi:hypothetical protein GCM10018952_14320 [Streptosporangium vulgare]
MSTRPRTAVMVPSVTMKALIPTRWTISPLTAPQRSPAPSAIAIAIGSPSVLTTLSTVAAEKAETEATERSKFPLIRTTVVNTARMATSDDWSRMLTMLVGDR